MLWGIFCIIAALAFANAGEATRQTTIVLINAVGSLLYGPILAAFIIGMVSKNISSFEVKVGVLSGIILNVVLWQMTTISWLWWNFTGFVTSIMVSSLLSVIWIPGRTQRLDSELVQSGWSSLRNWKTSYTMIAIYFFLIIVVTYFIQTTA